MALKSIDDRRRSIRLGYQGRVELNVRGAPSQLVADSINFSEGGMCVRLGESIDVRASVILRLFEPARSRPLECAGRVAWIVQRLDLREQPPFVYDVGVEFTNPSGRLRQFASRMGVTLKAGGRRQAPAGRGRADQLLEPVLIRGRRYHPRIRRETPPAGRWHLVVTVDDVPCFSQRFDSERQAVASWKQFKRSTSAARPRRQGRGR